MENEIPRLEWANEISTPTIKQEELVVNMIENEELIDPITGEKKPYECEGCSS